MRSGTPYPHDKEMEIVRAVLSAKPRGGHDVARIFARTTHRDLLDRGRCGMKFLVLRILRHRADYLRGQPRRDLQANPALRVSVPC
jgi:hypothetical protein